MSVSMLEPSDDRRATRDAASAIAVVPDTSGCAAQFPQLACKIANNCFGTPVFVDLRTPENANFDPQEKDICNRGGWVEEGRSIVGGEPPP